MMAETGNTSDAYAHARFDVSQDATGGRPTIRLDLTEDATRETLLDAQKHPEQYKHLVVRVAGYSALFTSLSRSLQDDIIRRTEQCGF
mgnify:CR=1 FL=1